MAIIKELRGFVPKLGKGCFFAENAVIIGDVIAGESCSFWYGSVVRGDVNSIRIGNNVNIQDGAVIHCNYKDSVTIIGDNVSIGHNAIVHGAAIGNNVLIGMGAIVMDHAIIGDNCLIAAGCIITKHMQTEPGSVYAGIPAKKIKSFKPEQLGRMTLRSADQYRMYLDWYREEEGKGNNE
ncbi:MAG: gamma carbonic anhydrase family protein [Bacteroidia bacterium]|nr:MAG: gamma carbonic anhydrase family protein [Bacteroidia bacterium]